MLTKEKRGATAFIATILIIGMVIALFAIVSQGSRLLIREKGEEAKRAAAKAKCPAEFKFGLDACWFIPEGQIGKSEGKGILNVVIGNQYTKITKKSEIMLFSQGRSQSMPLYEVGDIDITKPAEVGVVYSLNTFGIEGIEKVKVLPLYIDKEENIAVLCENFPWFEQIKVCKTEGKCNDSTKNGECSWFTPSHFCDIEKSIGTEPKCNAPNKDDPSKNYDDGCACPIDWINCEIGVDSNDPKWRNCYCGSGPNKKYYPEPCL